jgi:hypothetical protein
MYNRCNSRKRLDISVAIFSALSDRRYPRLLQSGQFSFALPRGINNVVGVCLRVQVTSVVSVPAGLLGYV